MIIFDGYRLALKREEALKKKIEAFVSDRKPVIAAVLFTEDAGSQLYTRLKGEMATRVGIEYRSFEFSLQDDIKQVEAKILELNQDPDITGIIIQKPWRNTWVKAQDSDFLERGSQTDDPESFKRNEFNLWWSGLTSLISEKKDVDGLHPNTISQIKAGTWQSFNKVLPATCQAVLTIMGQAEQQLVAELGPDADEIFNGKYVILGKSDLLGIPLYYELIRQNKNVEILDSKGLEEKMISGQKLLDFRVIISATGKHNLINGEMLSEGCVVIDVGEPKPDVEFNSVSKKASFITPVPGGVGPMTVVSLLENCVELSDLSSGDDYQG
jgi:methylenetetrahydrofolate dehydrogenase (NADP+) / methenyltetrahydrofolate cyclohydrolase